MSNNKQTMKLYTEEQVIEVFEKYGNMSAINARNILDLSESIELPSDEEIEKYFTHDLIFGVYRVDYNKVEGAKWMRDKIQGGNNDKTR